MSLIRLDAVTKIYRRGEEDIFALKNASLSIEKGDFLAVLGPSGSGKSTLIGLIGALERPSSGTVEILGKSTAAMTDRELAQLRNKKIGFVFQSFHLIKHFTALENVMLPLFYAREPRSRAREKALAILKSVGLSGRAYHKPGQLSGGEQQRVAIARAVAADPEILLADEPTGNLDSKAGDQVLELFDRINHENGATLILVTHNQKAAEPASRKIHLDDGIIRS